MLAKPIKKKRLITILTMIIKKVTNWIYLKSLSLHKLLVLEKVKTKILIMVLALQVEPKL